MWRWLLTTTFVFTFSVNFGFLSTPFSIHRSQFLPSVIAMLFTWAFLLVTGFYYLEATLASPMGSNIYSISKRYIGNFWKWITSGLFVAVSLLYLTVNFFLSAHFVMQILDIQSYGIQIAIFITYIVILVVILQIGVHFTLAVNFIFAVIMLVISLLSFKTGFGIINLKPTQKISWVITFLSLPVFFNIFSFQILIPTISDFLQRQRSSIISSLATGVSLGVLFSIAWLWLIKGLDIEIIPDYFLQKEIGYYSFEVLSYEKLIQIPYIGKWISPLFYIGLMAATLGLALIMVDFFSDAVGLSYENRKGVKRLRICLFISILVAGLLFIFPTQLTQLSAIFGVIGTICLEAIMPTWWVYRARMDPIAAVKPVLPGGKILLFISFLFAFLFIYLLGLQFFWSAIL